MTLSDSGAGAVSHVHIGASDRDLSAGQRVGEYLITDKLGVGGFGTVFRAEHPLIGKQVAIKVLGRQWSADPEMVKRFIAEARAVNQIRHRNIIDIFGFGQLEDGRHYYVMEYLDGVPLDGYLVERGRLSLEEAIPILRAVARALDAAHANGIAHRDLKPENVFLVMDETGGPFPKLLDFGIAKLLNQGPAAEHMSLTGAPMGTPHYMSPEQSRGRNVNHRTDIYAFGCMAYQMLTGSFPFDGADYVEILLQQVGRDPIPPSVLVPELAIIDDGIAWMLQKDPDARPPTVGAAMRALEQAAADAGLIVPADASGSGNHPVARPRSGPLTPPAMAAQSETSPTLPMEPTPQMPAQAPPASQTERDPLRAEVLHQRPEPSARPDAVRSISRRRALLFASIAVAVIAGAAVLVTTRGGDGDVTSHPPSQASPAPSGSADPVTGRPPPSSASPSTASATPVDTEASSAVIPDVDAGTTVAEPTPDPTAGAPPKSPALGAPTESRRRRQSKAAREREAGSSESKPATPPIKDRDTLEDPFR